MFKSVDEACEKIKTDKEYTPSGDDYSIVYSEFERYDNILNVRRGDK